MKNRFICIILVIALLLSFDFTIFANEYRKGSITVYYGNSQFVSNVLIENDKNIYVPLEWLNYYGALDNTESETEYEYYYPGQKELKMYAKRLFIDKYSNDFSICIYRKYEKKGKRKNFITIYDGEFSDKITYNNRIYVPIEELLPLMNAEISVSSDDGALVIDIAAMSLSQAIYNSDVEEYVFNADSIIGGKFMKVSGFVIDTAADFRLDRLLGSTGRQNDYETLFKAYLTSNDTYLSSMNEKESSRERQLKFAGEVLKERNAIEEMFTNGYVVSRYMGADTSDLDELFKVSGEYDAKMHTSDWWDAVGKIYNYYSTYENQIEDHRKMLSAVYDYDVKNALTNKEKKELKNMPSYKAAKDVEKLYDKEIADKLKTMFKEGTEDAIVDAGEKYLSGHLNKLNSGFLSFKIAKEIAEYNDWVDFDLFTNASMIGLMSNVADKAKDTYTKRLFDGDYDKESRNDLRLCAIMSLLSSKHAYKSVCGDSADALIDKINEMLTEFYLAAEDVGCDCTGYYKKTKKSVEKELKKLEYSYTVYDDEHTLLGVYNPDTGEYEGLTIDGYTPMMSREDLRNLDIFAPFDLPVWIENCLYELWYWIMYFYGYFFERLLEYNLG